MMSGGGTPNPRSKVVEGPATDALRAFCIHLC